MALPANPGLQGNAYAALNDYQSLAQQFWALYLACQTMHQRQANHGYIALLQNTQTYAVNADGTPGATDGTPNNAHPRAGTYLTASEASGFDGAAVNDFITFIEGTGSATTEDRRVAIQQMMP